MICKKAECHGLQQSLTLPLHCSADQSRHLATLQHDQSLSTPGYNTRRSVYRSGSRLDGTKKLQDKMDSIVGELDF